MLTDHGPPNARPLNFGPWRIATTCSLMVKVLVKTYLEGFSGTRKAFQVCEVSCSGVSLVFQLCVSLNMKDWIPNTAFWLALCVEIIVSWFKQFLLDNQRDNSSRCFDWYTCSRLKQSLVIGLEATCTTTAIISCHVHYMWQGVFSRSRQPY